MNENPSCWIISHPNKRFNAGFMSWFSPKQNEIILIYRLNMMIMYYYLFYNIYSVSNMFRWVMQGSTVFYHRGHPSGGCLWSAGASHGLNQHKPCFPHSTAAFSLPDVNSSLFRSGFSLFNKSHSWRVVLFNSSAEMKLELSALLL